MIFQYTWEWVVGVSHHTGKPKTATRRLWVADDYTWMCGMLNDGFPPVAIYSEIVRASGKPRYQRGRRVAVMPARGVRGMKKVADFEIAALWRQDVRMMSDEDAHQEGFANAGHFLQWWTVKYDGGYAPGGDELRAYVDDRNATKYDAAVIEWLPESLVLYPAHIQIAKGKLA